MDTPEQEAPPDGAPESGSEAAPQTGDNEVVEQDADAARDAAWDELEEAETGEKPAGGDPDSGASGDEPPDPAAQAGDGTEGGQAGGDEPPADDAPDPWADAPAELREAFQAERSARERAEHSAKSAEGRSRAYQQRIDRMMAGETTPATRQTDGAPAATDAPPADAGGEGGEPSAEEWESFERDYPEIAGAVSRRMAGLERRLADREQHDARVDGALRTLGEERMDTRASAQADAVMERHADFNDLADSDDLIAWARTQPAHIRAGFEANAVRIQDAEVVNDILDRYKRDKGIAAAPNGDGGTSDQPNRQANGRLREAQRRSAAGAPPSSGGAAVARGRQTPQTHDEAWDEIEKAEEAKRKAA